MRPGGSPIAELSLALVAATILLFGAGLLDVAGWLEVPWARYLCPVPLMFILPTIERKAIPAVGQLETVGKRSYGLYLTHLIVMNLVLIALELIGDTVVMVVLIFPCSWSPAAGSHAADGRFQQRRDT